MLLGRPEVQRNTHLRQLVLANTDFEDLYHSVMTGACEEPVRVDLEAAVQAVYERIDHRVRGFTFASGSAYPVNIYGVQRLIGAFAGRRDRPGFFFTLNQDLFVERHYYNGPPPLLPGMSGGTRWFSTVNTRLPLARVESPSLGTSHTEHVQGAHLLYLKLHGSCNWRGSGSPSEMVIGRSKADQIQRHPLLSWYLGLFREALCQQDSRLLIIGYGFGDPHINRLIGDAVSDTGLRVFIVSPTPADSVKQRLLEADSGRSIWPGLAGYYPANLSEVFPADQSESELWTAIQSEVLDDHLNLTGRSW